MSLLRQKLPVLVCALVGLVPNTAKAAILYGSTLNTRHLVKIDTASNGVTILHNTVGNPDSLILRGSTLIYDESDMSTVKIFDLVTLTDFLIADSTNHIVAPQDMVLEPSGNSILVSNFAGGGPAGNITRVLLNGTQNGTILANINAPQGISYDNAGRLFVAFGGSGTCPATGTALVSQIDPTSGATLKTSAAFDASNSLDAMLFDPFSGHLWLTAKCGGNLYEVDPGTLALLSTFCLDTGTNGACPAGASSFPDGLATDGHGTLYVVVRNDANPGTNAQVGVFSIAGRTITKPVTVPGLDDLAQLVATTQVVTKAFSAPPCPPTDPVNPCVALSGSTTLTLTITNQNTFPLTNVSFADTFPGQIHVAAVPAATNTCGGTFTTVANSGGVTLTGGTLPAAVGAVLGTCTLTVQVTGVLAGTGTNSVAVTSTEGGTSPPATAVITVQGPVVQTIIKSFSAPPCPPTDPVNACVALSNSTTLTFRISNPNTFPLSGLTFTDNLPAQIHVAGTPAATNTCGGTFNPVANAASVTLTGGGLAASGNCILTVQVTGVLAGTGTNTVTVTSVEAGTSAPSTALISVQPPVIVPTKSFNPKIIFVNQISTVTINFVNATASAGTAAFTDNLPGGLVVAAPPAVANTCGGTVTATAGSSTVSLAGGTVPGNGACAVSFNVTGIVGVFVNTLPPPSNSSDTLTIVGPPTLAKAFNPPGIGPNAITTLTFTITNPNLTAALATVAFTDTLPVGLTFTGTITGTCNGTAPVIIPPSTISLANATLPAGGTCIFSAAVTGANSGLFLNTTSNITATVIGVPGTLTGPPATAGLGIAGPPTDAFQIRYASNLNVGDSVVNVTNTGASTTGGSAGNLCVNVYTFDQSEELLSCCTCFVTPNGLQSMSVKGSLLSNNLTPEIPNSAVIKLVATAGGTSQTSCNAGVVTQDTLAGGMRAWGTTLHPLPTTPTSYAVAETPFSVSNLSQGELNHLTSFCSFIQSNASGFGICKGCTPVGLGATTAR